MPIQRLEDDVIAMIAAGEVVERPASALKELMENAIDSEANRIDVDISEGGMSYLKVSDNGHGISPNEIVLAVQPHSTSKLQKASQLETVDTLGFRGEALASIASLSNLTIRSRPQGVEEGMELKLHGSWQKEKPTKCVMQQGTEIIVSELYVHAPARRKYVRKPQTEWAHCETVVRKLAMGHHQIGFTMSRDGLLRHEFVPQSREKRIQAVLGDKFFAEATAVVANIDPMSLYGFVEVGGRGLQSRQHIVLNGRSINDRMLRKAIRKACFDAMRNEDIPYAFFLDLPQQMVDVNAHPAKAEVRFRESRAMFKFVYNAVSKAIQEPVGAALGMPMSRPGNSPGSPIDALLSLGKAGKDFSPDSMGGMAKATDDVTTGMPFSSLGELLGRVSSDGGALPRDLGKAIALLHGVYLLAENYTGMVLVDIHAAHERIIYEDLKGNLKTKISSQKFVEQIELRLTTEAMDALVEHRKLMGKMGFTILNEEGAEYLCSIPSILVDKVTDPADLASQCLEELAEYGISFANEELQNKILATVSCHAAVRGAQEYVSLKDLNGLLRKMENTLSSGKCNHGRPTWRILKLKDIDSYFERGE